MARHERRLLVTLTIAVVVLVLNGLWASAALRTLIDDNARYSHTRQVIAQIEGLRSTIAEATAAVRAYLFTGDGAYLTSYRAAVDRFHQGSARLQQLTVDNPAQERRLALLNQAIGVRLALCAEVIETRQRQGLDAARGLFMSRRNDAVVAQAGSLLVALEQEEELRLLEARTSRSDAAERTAKLAYLLVNLLAAGFLAAVWFQARAAAAERSRHELELVDQREWHATALQREREQLLERERHSRHTAESANRAKDSYLANISHQLRTPLGVILGWAGILRAANADARTVGHAADVVERNARILAKLVDDMLDISRIVSGKVQIEPVEIDPGVVVTAVVEALRPAAEEKDVGLDLLLEPLPGPVVADPQRLQQVVWNLLSNAIKFSCEGGQVKVTLGVAGDRLRIEVCDDGCGIAPERLPYVFERFWQADTSSTRRHGGLGLGLAIVRHLVEMHGGRVTAASAGEGHGSTFAIEIPVRGPKEAAAAAAGRTAVAAAAAPPGPALVGRRVLHGARILVVDDEQDAAEWVAELLGAEGAEVRTADSAAAGLAELRRWRPDLLIADVGMPGEDGYGLMRRVRALGPEEGRQTIALALTAHARPEDRMRVLSVGYQMHAAKPIDPIELLIVSASLLNRPL
ncbi:MAG TPA: ATP-binding protein [Thermoanaerobaculia bacterium]|jgi:signal transduction histidine kinase|nr:ATP-binding protein [Thermoanaerobaculia bacterium]